MRLISISVTIIMCSDITIPYEPELFVSMTSPLSKAPLLMKCPTPAETEWHHFI